MFSIFSINLIFKTSKDPHDFFGTLRQRMFDGKSLAHPNFHFRPMGSTVEFSDFSADYIYFSLQLPFETLFRNEFTFTCSNLTCVSCSSERGFWLSSSYSGEQLLQTHYTQMSIFPRHHSLSYLEWRRRLMTLCVSLDVGLKGAGEEIQQTLTESLLIRACQ